MIDATEDGVREVEGNLTYVIAGARSSRPSIWRLDPSLTGAVIQVLIH